MHVLTELVKDEDAYHEPETQLVLTAIAYVMGGKAEVTVDQVLNYDGTRQLEAQLILKGFFEKTAKKLIRTALNTAIPGSATALEKAIKVYSTIKTTLEAEDGQFSDWCDFLDESMDAIQNMSDEEYQQYYSRHQSTFAAITEQTGIEISTHADMRNAKLALNDGIVAGTNLLDDASYAITNLNGLLDLGTGHIQDTYVLGINSRWCGYQGQKGIAAGSFTIPSDVTTIGPECFAECGELEAVQFPESLLAVGYKAFSNDAAIVEVEMPDGTRAIGNYAFEKCSGMQRLVIPRTINNLEQCVVSGCTGLKELTLPVELSKCDHVFVGCTGVETIHYTLGSTGVMQDRSTDAHGKDYYGNSLEYASRSSLRNVDFEEGITQIGAYTFYPNGNETALNKVVLPSTLKSIGKYAFCSQSVWAEDLVLPEGLSKLGEYCFYGCKSLTSVTLPKTLVNVPAYCFYNCESITTLGIPDTMKTIGEYAFLNCKSLHSLTLPKSTTALGKYAFWDCTGLKEVTLPVELPIASCMFGGCNGVETIHYTLGSTGVMQDLSTYIYGGNYYGYSIQYSPGSNLQRVDFEEGITHIGAYAFYINKFNTVLNKVVLPSTLESIGPYAFYGQSVWAEDLVLPEGLSELGEECFSGCKNIHDLVFTGAAPEFGKLCLYGVTATAYYPAYDPTWTESVRQNYGGHITWVGVKLALDREELLLAAPDLGFGDVTQLTCAAPEGYGLDGLTWSSDAPAVATVEDGLVRGLSAGTAVITARAGSLEGRCAVTVRDDLSVLRLSAGLTEIGPEAFSGLAAVEAVVLPEGVTRIGASAFAGCSGLLMINIPDAVADIAPDAFDGCPQVCLYCDPESPAASLGLRWEPLP